MELGLLTLIACTLGGGIAGGLLSAWGCYHKLLALELTLKAVFTGYEDRFNELERITTRDVKRAAVETRWRKGKDKDEEFAKELIAANTNLPVGPVGHPWDPRTWGGSR
jgi:formiminotetrahydrofolate cyclodeaminase